VRQRERGAQEAVEGERGVSTLKLARSTRSRVSNLLALGLVLAVGASLLGWYYSNIVARQVRAPQRASARPSGAAPADVPPPPLGEIHPPDTRLLPATSASPSPAVTLVP